MRDDQPLSRQSNRLAHATRALPPSSNPVDSLPGTEGHTENTEVDHAKQSMTSQRSGSPSGDDMSQDGRDQYEQERQRQIMKNRELLSSLGIASSSNLLGSHHDPAASKKPRKERAKRQGGPSKPVFDRSGYVISLPPPGTTHTIACVEMPSDRSVRRRIAEGEYQDCSHWREGEARRWRFGRGRGGVLAEGEEEYIGGVGADFRWRKWRGLEKELRIEMRRRGQLIEQDARPQPATQVLPDGVSAYSLLPPESCHQCRRRSEKAKMKCRNLDPPCKATFCETCCKRYNYFSFDPDSRSFICPLCRDCCNCANCIRKRNLAHLLGPGRTGVKASAIRGGEGMTVQQWLQEKALDQDIKAPFDRVRLVDQAQDIVSPELPPEPKAPPAPKGTKRKNASGTGEARKKAKGKKGKTNETIPVEEDKNEVIGPRIKLVLKVNAANHPPIRREKEVDSDGDTVGGWSDEEQLQGSESDLTPISEDEQLPPRFAFPTLHRPDTVDTVPPILGFESQASISTETSVDAAADRPLLAAWTPHDSATLDMRNLASINGPTTKTLRPQASSSTVIDDTTPSVSSSQPIRRKPPPTAHIARAPRHGTSTGPSGDSSARVSPAPELPASSDPTLAPSWVSSTNDEAAPKLAAQSFTQTFSYANDSLVPPASLSPTQAIFTSTQTDVWLSSLQADPSRSFPQPPPYSHSPPSRSVQLPSLNLSTSTSISAEDRFPPLESPVCPELVQETSQNLDLLSMAASHAQQGITPTSTHPFRSVGRPDHTLMAHSRLQGTLLGSGDAEYGS